MYYSPHPDARAADFQKSVSLPKSFKRPLGPQQAQNLANKCEQLFRHVNTATQQGAMPGTLRMRHRDGELLVRVSGNSQEGKLVLSRGESLYTQVNFNERAITIFQSQTSSHGFVRTEAAAVVDRQRPRGSASFGKVPCLESFLQAGA